jgi:hypothetical protein
MIDEHNRFSAVCPEDELLIQYKTGKLTQDEIDKISEHLVLCDYCSLALDLLPTGLNVLGENESLSPSSSDSDEFKLMIEGIQQRLASEHPLNPIALEKFRESKRALEVAQIWQTRTEDILFPSHDSEEMIPINRPGSIAGRVVITKPFVENRWFGNKAQKIIRVAPIHDSIDYAMDGDIIFQEKESLLGYPFMLELWNQQDMLFDNLHSYLGEIEVVPESLLARSIAEGFDLKTFLANHAKNPNFADAANYSTFGLIRTGKYYDPKMRFRAMQFENTAYLRDPVIELREMLDESVVSISIEESLQESVIATVKKGMKELIEAISAASAPVSNLLPAAANFDSSKNEPFEFQKDFIWIERKSEENGEMFAHVCIKNKDLEGRDIQLQVFSEDENEPFINLDPIRLTSLNEDWIEAKIPISPENQTKMQYPGAEFRLLFPQKQDFDLADVFVDESEDDYDD